MPRRELTPTQRKILSLLADGGAHAARELARLLPDDLGAVANVKPHLSRLRKTLRAKGEDIRCEIQGGAVRYRHVRADGSDNPRCNRNAG
jgi:DNA-binding CsgD family transcriptional regulator